MVIACSDPGHTGEIGGVIKFTEAVVAPPNDRAVALQGKIKDISGGNRDHICRRSRDVFLTVKIIAPNGNGPVAFESNTMIEAASDSNDTAQCGRYRDLSE